MDKADFLKFLKENIVPETILKQIEQKQNNCKHVWQKTIGYILLNYVDNKVIIDLGLSCKKCDLVSTTRVELSLENLKNILLDIL